MRPEMRLRRAFDRAAVSFDAHAVLHQEVRQRLLERLDYFALQPERVLDLGCGTAAGAAALQARWPEALVLAVDSSKGMLRQQGRRPNAGAGLCADLAALPLAAASVDLVFCNLVLPWVSQFEAALQSIRRVMRPGSLLLFTGFGPGTLPELRQAWAAVDDRPHVNEFPDIQTVGDSLVRCGFRDPVLDLEQLRLEYQSVGELLQDLQATGSRMTLPGHRRGLGGKASLQAMQSAYATDFGQTPCPATVEIVYATAFAPPEGQPIRHPEGEVATFSVATLRKSHREKGLQNAVFGVNCR